MGKIGIKDELIDVLSRLIKKTPDDTDVQVKIRQFCSDYIQSDEELIKSLTMKLGVVGMATTVPYLILLSHIFLVTGMRYTHDFGIPEGVKDLFGEVKFFEKLEGELKE